MKHPTSHLKKLKSSVVEARAILRRVPRTGSQTTLDHLKVQSYVLLVHSALEVYLESLGRDCALAARNMIKNDGNVCMSLLGLVSAKLIRDVPEKSKSKLKSDVVANIEAFSTEAMNEYHALISGNNGIKRRDQKKLMYPIGIDPEAIDIATMNNLDAFGEIRGNIAHQFSAIRNELTRGDVESKVRIILSGIELFDKAACKALSKFKL